MSKSVIEQKNGLLSVEIKSDLIFRFDFSIDKN
jgi:hypothetical protein